MTWQFYLGCLAGAIVAGPLGYVFGAIFSSAGRTAAAEKEVEAADKAADSEREAIDADAHKKLEQTATSDGRALVDALNDDYASPPRIPGVVLHGEGKPAADASEPTVKPASGVKPD